MDSKKQQDALLIAEQLLKESEITPVAGVSLGEKLHSMFKRNDLVRVKNIDDKPSGYVFVNPDDEVVQMPNKATRRVTPGKPQAVVLQPGEVKVLPGWQAYIALDRLWKEYAQRRSSDEHSLMSDDVARDKFLSESFLGLFDPNAPAETRPAAWGARKQVSGDAQKKDDEAPHTTQDGDQTNNTEKKVDSGDDLGFDG